MHARVCINGIFLGRLPPSEIQTPDIFASHVADLCFGMTSKLYQYSSQAINVIL